MAEWASFYVIVGGLLIIGIHNSWDTVTHIVATNSGEET